MQLSPSLRTVLKLDAASCLAMAIVLVPGAAALESIGGIPAAVLSKAGVSLIMVGFFILWLGMRTHASPALVRLVVFGNVGWVIGSVALAAILPEIRLFGLLVLLGQAIAVAVFALLEWRGLRESSCKANA